MMTDNNRAQSHGRVLEILDLFRREYPDLGLTGLVIFMFVAENPGVGIREIACALRATKATASRAARSLIAEQFEGALPPYHGLLTMFLDPDDERCRRLYPSKAGERLLDKLNP